MIMQGKTCRRVSGVLVATLLVVIQGCAGLLPPVEYHDADFVSRPLAGLPVILRYLPRDASVIPVIEQSIREGIEKADRWGALRRPVTVRVLPDHRALEKAVHKRGYVWLKAWATEKRISLQSPRSWTVMRRKNLFDLMAHELTHVVYYQTAGIRASRTGRNDPFWFREGLASVTAGQGYRRYSKERLLGKLQADPAFDPLSPTREEIRDHPKLAYSSAHYLVAYLIEEYGDQKIRNFLHRIAQGDSFDTAFEETFPIPLNRLTEEWILWIKKGKGIFIRDLKARTRRTLFLPCGGLSGLRIEQD